MTERIRAFLAAALPGISGEVPGEIQWMPPGRHKITPEGELGPVSLEVDVTEAVAQRIAGQLQAYRTRAAAGTDDLPYLDFNHDDREAAGHPTEVFWGRRGPEEWRDPNEGGMDGGRERRAEGEGISQIFAGVPSAQGHGRDFGGALEYGGPGEPGGI
jgi:hypothetical protein